MLRKKTLDSRASLILSILLYLPLTAQQLIINYPALVITPVCDLTGSPQSQPSLLPLCPVSSREAAQSCPRLHQALFNEIVLVKELRGHQAKIQLPNCFYQISPDPKPITQYWTSTQHLLPLTALNSQTHLLPAPIDFQHPRSLHQPKVVTLRAPYYEPLTQTTYSAGTRFVLAAPKAYLPNVNNHSLAITNAVALLRQHSTDKLASARPERSRGMWRENSHQTTPVYQVYIYQPIYQQFIRATIPAALCLAPVTKLTALTPALQRARFVRLLQSWAHPQPFAQSHPTDSLAPIGLLTTPTPITTALAGTNILHTDTQLRAAITNSTPTQHQSKNVTTPSRRDHESPFIPYVWGGCSFTDVCTDPHFQLVTVPTKTKRGKAPASSRRRYFSYPHYRPQPYSGFDCSGLVLRAAQAVGLPYFYKNTATILANLKPLTADDQLENGDLIWLPAHMMVITDVKRQLCLEARHYGHGYGRVHELPIQQVFANAPDLAALKTAHLQQTPLSRLDRNGVVRQQVKIKLLKLPTYLADK